jgi:aryl-alcohol dehydrogenase-like predicted oxidoreductase
MQREAIFYNPPMEYVNLGTTGTKVSRICLGMMTYGSSTWREWVLDEEASKPLIRRAVEAGINFFDTADMYSVGVSEEITGRALKEFAGARENVVIATKVFNLMGDGPNDRGLSRKHIMAAVDASLKRLGVDYIDLYQIHRFDPHTPIEETVEALSDVVRAGKALYLGASSMYAWQFLKMLETQRSLGLARFKMMQNHYNLVYREEEREMIPLCQSEGVGLYYRPSDFTVVDRLSEIATARGVKNAQVALAWMLAKPGITAPIVGASKMYQLEDALAALEIKLTPEEIAKLEEPYEPHPVLGHSY